MLTRYDPFREALSLRRAMDQLFEQSFVNPSAMAGSQSMIVPMDICETENGYEVDVALPGVRPEDIDLIVDQNTLTIRGHYSHQDEHQHHGQQQAQPGQMQQQAQPVGQQQAQPIGKQQAQPMGQQPAMGQQTTGQSMQQTQTARMERHRKGHNWLSREIISGSFERSVTFPKPIDTERIQTNFQNGILSIQIPVSEASRPKHISVTGAQGQQQIPVGAGRS
jgi:HSP20 family molecular chaperone IbpA